MAQNITLLLQQLCQVNKKNFFRKKRKEKMTSNYENAISAFNQVGNRIAAELNVLQETKAKGFNTLVCSVCQSRGRSMKKATDETIICQECERNVVWAVKRSDTSFIPDQRPTDEELEHAEDTKAQLMLIDLGPSRYRDECLLRRALANVIEKAERSEITVEPITLNAQNPCDCCANVKGFDMMENTFPVPVNPTDCGGYRFTIPLIQCDLKVCHHCRYQSSHENSGGIKPFTFIPAAIQRHFAERRAGKTV